MKKNSLVVIFTIAIMLIANFSFSQTEDEKNDNLLSVSCDLVSRYVWRGTDFSASPSIQPGVEFIKSGFTIGAWGAYAMNLTGAQEADLYVGYTYKDMFSLTVTDYFFPNEMGAYKYFEFDKDKTGHVLESSLSFNGTEKLPLTILLATNVWGADATKLNSDGTKKGIQYSTYAELGYSYKNISAFMGFNFTNPNETLGETGFYGNGFGVVNLGLTATKDIIISNKFKLPLSVSIITNPQAEKIYLVAGISF